MRMKKVFVKSLCVFFAIFMFCMCFTPLVSAAESKNPMLSTYVVNDLHSYGFNLADYPIDESSDYVLLMHFQEYGLARSGDRSRYDLYVYVYNASGKPIQKSGNYIQLAYNKNNIYRKYSLEFLSVSNEVSNENLFYKFRVSGIEQIAQNITTSERHYDISGIELNFVDNSRDDDYPVQQHWEYIGFQYNFGSDNPAGTLTYKCSTLETIDIELHGARWFSDDSNYGKNFRYEVSSVYFAIPNSIISKYGNIKDPNGTSGLVSVQGCYNKYGINGLIVENQAAYNEFIPCLNRNRLEMARDYVNGRWADDPQGAAFWSDYIKKWPHFFVGIPVFEYDPIGALTIPVEYECTIERQYDNAFQEFLYEFFGQGNENNIFSSSFHLGHLMLLSKGSSAIISEDDLYNLWVSSGKPCHLTPDTLYMGSLTSGISKDLQYFNVSVKDGDLSSSIKSYLSTKETQFGKFIAKLFNGNLGPETYPECRPLHEITYFNIKDLLFTEESMCNEMYMSQSDLQDFDKFYDAKNLGNHIYIMRFGVDPYFCGSVYGGTNISTKNGERAWYYEKTVYDNFDILSFTFQDKRGGISVVPVNCKPITIIGSVVPGTNAGGFNPNGDFKDFRYYLNLLWSFLKKLKIFPILMGILVILVVIKFVWPLLKKLGNAGLEVAKARASRPKNENRDKSPPTEEVKDKSPPAPDKNDNSSESSSCAHDCSS